ncbi:hypothetical protein [Weissella koreensis]|uniref:Uncharacterized protein n=1 Tax=Weissella koreensis TaxID=165096 RepID=A0A7H1MMY2_9LACO|nr:hypothetical protein [Weissella koreensis]AVH75614.1 hypothetical protein C4597_06285 [Weissella koreensis]EJF34601.1 hypothetical protein JC2156_14410 [Weissella koreensis KCTC 3621]QGN20837.1 hypothetical protein GKC51_06265 [Weissella koreensis]QNT64818.1 hypothetical protein FY536_06000 [Weissella koreensis]
MKNLTKGILLGTLTAGVAAATAYYRSLSPMQKEAVQDRFLDQLAASKVKMDQLKNDTTDHFNILMSELRYAQENDEGWQILLADFKQEYINLSNQAKNQYTYWQQALAEQVDAHLDIDVPGTMDQIQSNYSEIKNQAAKVFTEAKSNLVADHQNSKNEVDKKIDEAQAEFDIVLDAQQADVKAALGLAEDDINEIK